MGDVLYTVRQGKPRREGRYMCRPPFQVWESDRATAIRFEMRSVAAAWAERYGGRVVRLVRRKRCPECHAVCSPPSDEASARLATATALLREVEWIANGCVFCCGRRTNGHARDCPLAASLAWK